MADWTDLPNTAVGVGGIPSGTTVTALRDNPVAIAERAVGAPKAIDDFELLSRTVIAGSPATIDFTYNGNLYDAIVFTFGNVRMGVDGRQLQMLTSSNSGASFDTGASDYQMQGSSTSTGTSQIAVSNATMGLAGSEAGFSGQVTIYGPNIALRTGIEISGSYWDASGSFVRVSTSASRVNNAVVNAVRFQSSLGSGFTNGGVISMYGVRNS